MDSTGGTHMMRRSLPGLWTFVLVAVAAAQSGPAASGQRISDKIQTAQIPTAEIPAVKTSTIKGVLDGPRTVVFDTATDSCELIDIPDAPARAFRDYTGTVHIVASHYIMRQSLGSTLES